MLKVPSQRQEHNNACGIDIAIIEGQFGEME